MAGGIEEEKENIHVNEQRVGEEKVEVK